MIVTDRVDLREIFDIGFVEYNCSVDLPGYSVETVSGGDDLVHLVKMSM
jgi:hypothetical protein